MHGLQAPRGASALTRKHEDSRLGGAGRVYGILGAVAVTITLLDQVTKQLALAGLRDGPIDLIPGIVTFRLTLNPGGAFGLGREWPGLFLAATVVVIVIILSWVRRVDDLRWLVPLGMIVGGGIGNLIDRVFRPFDGQVVDFVDLQIWPVFNVADSAIVVGVLLIALLSMRAPRDA
jgi:signal peptidase II